MRESIAPYSYVGIKVHPFGMHEWHSLIERLVRSRSRGVILSQNLHSVFLYNKDPDLQRLVNDPRTYMRIDGMPLVLIGRLFGFPLLRSHRLTWVDWLEPFMQECASHRWRVFYLGSEPEVCSRSIDLLRERYPSLDIQGTHGYFDVARDGPENESIVTAVNSSGADLLLVGMGMPRQERWILDNVDRLDPPVILTCGAAMEYVAGSVGTPPRWMGRAGLEWLFRLGENPKRFWRRYLVEPWYVLWLVVRDLANRMARRAS